MESIWTHGVLSNQVYPWVPFVTLMGCLLAFWWLRYKLPSLPHSISATAYVSRNIFTEFCLINGVCLGLLYAWESANYANDLGMFAMLVAALLLPWLARFWDFWGKHKIQHYALAILIFGGLAYWTGKLWWVPIVIAGTSYVLSEKYKIFWAEAVLLHLIIFSRIYAYYL